MRSYSAYDMVGRRSSPARSNNFSPRYLMEIIFVALIFVMGCSSELVAHSFLICCSLPPFFRSFRLQRIDKPLMIHTAEHLVRRLHNRTPYGDLS